MLSVRHETVWNTNTANVTIFVEEVVAKYAHNEQFIVDNQSQECYNEFMEATVTFKITVVQI